MLPMLNRKHVLSRSLASLQNEAIEKALRTKDNVTRWAKTVQDEDAPYRFNWAVEATRAPSAIASVYLVDGLANMNIKDRFLTPDLMRQGREWVMSMHQGDERYLDPAILEHKPPDWDDAAERWPPTGAHLESMSGACRKLFGLHYEGGSRPMADPPPDWPQLETVDTTLDWIKSHNNMSWTGRIITRLVRWTLDGKTDDRVLLDCLRYVYEQQDKETGMWGTDIVATFKILCPIISSKAIPLLHAEKLINTHLELLFSPGYEPDGLFPCVEYDFWYNINRAMYYVDINDFPVEDIKKIAAWRIIHILDHYTTDDGGIRSYLNGCIPTWLNIDMAPKKMQSDPFGLSLFTAGIIIAATFLGIIKDIDYKDVGSTFADEDEDANTIAALIKDKLADLLE
jgi:hypothetical protein